MDKNEYRAKLDEINDLVDRQDYEGALNIVDSIDWKRVRSARTLCMVGEIYEANQRYEDSRKLLLLAHQRAPIGKTVLYRLVELSIKMENFDEAVDYYNQFVEISPNDNSRYILKYKIYRARRSPIQEQITILEEYKGREYTERWAYELARLYAKSGNKEKCVEECDDLILWFSDGKYVTKAMELKMKYSSLSPSQQDKYNHRYDEKPTEAEVMTAAAITAATDAASKLVEQNTDELPAIESVRARMTGKAPEEVTVFTPIMETTSALQDRIAKGIREVFSGSEKPEQEEYQEAAVLQAESQDDFVIKELEPESLTQKQMVQPEAKPEIEEKAAEENTAEIPVQTEALESEDAVLTALLEETANELAKNVNEAELTSDEAESESVDVTVKEAAEAKDEPVQNEEISNEDIRFDINRASAAAAIAAAVAAQAQMSAAAQEVTATAEPGQLEGKTVELPIAEVKSALEVKEDTLDLEAMLASAVAASEKKKEMPLNADRILEDIDSTPQQEAAEESEAEPEIEIETAEESEAEPEIEIETAEESEAEPEIEIEAAEESEPKPEIEIEAAEESEPEAAEEPAPKADEKENTVQESVQILRHKLTADEQKSLFTYFAPIPGMKEQIMEVLDVVQESACQKTSRAGNLVITGRAGSGKTKLSEGIIKAICKERQMAGAKIAYLDANKLNVKDPAAVVGKLSGGFLVIENASLLKEDAVENLSKAMEFKTNRLTVILEDLKPGIKALEEKYPDFMEKFDGRIVVPVFTNDELVSFAKTYSKEVGYKIDDMAVLALYTLIGDNQNDEDPVSVAQVKDMMDEAISRASKGGRRTGKKIAKRHMDESGRIMLYEKDFDI